MNRDFDNDDVEFDRLVDGEVSPDERRRFLASLDDRPEEWRRCALAFLEAQSWQGEMRRLIAEPIAAPKQPASQAASPEKTSRGRSLTWLATAAAIFVAFGLGWRAGGPQSREEIRSLADVRPPNLSATVAAPAPSDDAVTLVVQDANGRPRRLLVPLVEGRQLGGQFAESPPWAAAAMRQEFQERGLNVKGRRRYAPLFFEQQDRLVPMIVPVDDAVITPVSRPVF